MPHSLGGSHEPVRTASSFLDPVARSSFQVNWWRRLVRAVYIFPSMTGNSNLDLIIIGGGLGGAQLEMARHSFFAFLGNWAGGFRLVESLIVRLPSAAPSFRTGRKR